MPSQQPQNHGKPWTSRDQQALVRLTKSNTPTGLIAHTLGRTEAAVRSHTSETHMSLKPTNQSPYNRRKK